MAMSVAIVRWCEVETPEAILAGLERVLFATAGPRVFKSDAERAAFRWRWLGQFLEYDGAQALVALARDGTVAGYLVGCFDDPAKLARFDELSYFQDFAPLTARYPAHLHINLDAAFRGAGLGSRLIAAFVEMAAAAGVAGVHVVTGRGARNVGFYNRNGFVERGYMTWNGREIVFLGRELVPVA
jgi:GNAT superfamily N-acetyltransferase